MKDSFIDEYNRRYSAVLQPLAKRLKVHLEDYFKDEKRIDRIVTRAKSIERFVEKSQKQVNGVNKYSDPLQQVQDQIGARIVTFYLSDVEKVAQVAQGYFRHIEKQDIVPDSISLTWKGNNQAPEFSPLLPIMLEQLAENPVKYSVKWQIKPPRNCPIPF